MIIETSNAIGTSMFVFTILPQLDLVRSIVIANGLSFVPSLLKLLYQLNMSTDLPLNTIEQKMLNFLKINPNKPAQKLLMFAINFTALLMQVSLIFVVIFTDFGVSFWKIPVCVLLVSVSIAKNLFSLKNSSADEAKTTDTFVDKTFKFMIRSLVNIDKSRHRIGLITSVWKIGVSLLFAHILCAEFDLTKFDSSFYAFVLPFLVQLGSSLIFYLSCALAFKLRMRRVCFALPLTLITPVSIVLGRILAYIYGSKNEP